MYRYGMIGCVIVSATATAQVCQNTIVRAAPDARYEVVAGTNGAEVLDLYTNLIWQRCSLGQRWSGTQCEGEAQTYSWVDALKQTAVQNPPVWRVPNIRELHSLVEDACHDSSTHPQIFPLTPAQVYWSASPSMANKETAWSVDFNIGTTSTSNKLSQHHVRMVRAGMAR